MSFRSKVLALVVLLFSFADCYALPPEVHHPLDGMTPGEYWKAYNVLKDAGKLAPKTLFASILLQEPPKAYVLGWKPGDPIVRKVDVVLLTDSKSYAAVVDVSTG